MNNFELTLKMSPHLYAFSSVLAYTVVALEGITVLLLFYHRLRLTGLWLSLGLMLSFITYIAYMFLYSSSLPCSCGGIIAQLSWKDHLLLNIFLSSLAAMGIYFQRMLNKKAKNA